MVGTRIADRYVIEGEIGRGGMGVVYRATDTRLKRGVALKIIAPHLVSDELARRRFLTEGEVLAGLTHANIVTLFDMLEDPESGEVVMVMELLSGVSLRECLGAAARPEFYNLAIPLCRALEAAHAREVLHRDIKPENIFVCADGTIKLMDFGLARLLDNVAASTENLTSGTVSYMAPEQIRAETLDARTDLYGLGVVLYEFLCGEMPFAGANVGNILMKQLIDAPVPPAERVPGLSREVNAIVVRLLEKDRLVRYDSARALRNALVTAQKAGPLVSTALPGLTSFPVQAASAPPPQPVMATTAPGFLPGMSSHAVVATAPVRPNPMKSAVPLSVPRENVGAQRVVLINTGRPGSRWKAVLIFLVLMAATVAGVAGVMHKRQMDVVALQAETDRQAALQKKRHRKHRRSGHRATAAMPGRSVAGESQRAFKVRTGRETDGFASKSNDPDPNGKPDEATQHYEGADLDPDKATAETAAAEAARATGESSAAGSH